MSILEIEQAITELSSEEKKQLFRDLAEQFEDIADSLLFEEGMKEGDAMPFEQYCEERFKK